MFQISNLEEILVGKPKLGEKKLRQARLILKKKNLICQNFYLDIPVCNISCGDQKAKIKVC